MNSGSVFAGRSLFTIISIGITPVMVTGVKSAIGSKGSLAKIARSVAWAMVV